MENMRLESERLLLRRFQPDDWPDLHEYLSQEETVKYEPYGVFSEESSQEEATQRAQNNDFWAVSLKSNGKLIGNLYAAKRDFDTWELGYVFNAKYHGAGYATEAARALVDMLFRSQGAHRVAAMCNPENERSWKLLERLGFRREGYLLQNVCFKKDEAGRPIWTDTLEYGMLASEWLKRIK